jgi:peroxiredoxin
MVRSLFSRIALMTVLAASTHAAWAALDIGDPAPKFTANAALGGKTFRYSLADALAKGPVVLYFFPAADSNDCSIEAHAFAEAIDKFAALGATVIGVSADDIDTLSKFSVKSCQSRFPVASDVRAKSDPMQQHYIANTAVRSSSERTLPVIDPSDGQQFDTIQRGTPKTSTPPCRPRATASKACGASSAPPSAAAC